MSKKNLPGINLQSNDDAAVPLCMKENETCKDYIRLIMKLGKLAFFTLFGDKKESSLIFDSKVVTQYITKQEIDFCLKVGLLCQSKDNSILADRRFKVFFQHKTVQEFFSAIFITSEWENNTVKLIVLNACLSLESIFEMSNLIVFVCDMNHEVYTCISDEIQKIVDLDVIRHRYRSDMYNPEENVYCRDLATLASYQKMQWQCFQCARKIGCLINLYDIVIDDGITEDDFTLSKPILHLISSNVKSLSIISPNEKIGGFAESLDPGVFTSLETLKVKWCDKEPVWLADILTEYARTLKYLTILAIGPRMSLSGISISALTRLTCLKSLYFWFVFMTHSNMELLYAYISQTTTLTQLTLWMIGCLDHFYANCDVPLDLMPLKELKMIYLNMFSCRTLHLTTTCLDKFVFRPLSMTDSAIASLLEDLCTAPVLTSLTLNNMPSSQMIQINHTLTQLQHQLQYLKLANIDMDSGILRFSTEMTTLECLELENVNFLSAARRNLFNSVGQLPRSITIKLVCSRTTSTQWRKLLLSVGGIPHVVTVELYRCIGPSRKQWTAIVNVIKSTPTLSLLQDLSFDDHGSASLTLKKQ